MRPNIINLQAARTARQQVLTAKQIEQRAPANNAERRVADSSGEQRRLLWVSEAEAEFLSHMYQYGLEAAAKRLMQVAGKPWPEQAPKRAKAKAARPAAGHILTVSGGVK